MKIHENKYLDSTLTNNQIFQHTRQFIGGKWKIAILWSLKDGCKRFSDLRRELIPISEKILIQELKHLQYLHIVNRKSYHQMPPKVEYGLTARGKSLISLIANLIAWSFDDMEKHDIEIFK